MKRVLCTVFVLLIIISFSSAQSEKGLEITDIAINGGYTGNQPLLPDDLMYDGLEAGVCLWWDRCGLEGGTPYTVESLPDYLVGKTYLKMTADDKWTHDVPNYLTCTVNKPVIMYVLYDARQDSTAEFFPSWLLEWELMPEDVAFNDCWGDSCKIRYLDIYKNTFPAGSITLGSNNENGYDWSALHYIPVWEVDESAPSAVWNTLPEEYDITVSNYPNPFNPSTEIIFTISHDGYVMLNIFDMLGHKIRSLVNKHVKKGEHHISWNGQNDNGQDVPSGSYFYQLKAGEKNVTNKMILLR